MNGAGTSTVGTVIEVLGDYPGVVIMMLGAALAFTGRVFRSAELIGGGILILLVGGLLSIVLATM